MGTFINSVIRGAGLELGRSSMRTVLNPVLKGKDARPVSVISNDIIANPKNMTILEENVIKVGKESSLAGTIAHFIFTLIMTVFILPVGMIIIGMKIGKLTEPVRILTFDKPYYKADRRSRTGFLPDRTAQVINVEEVENPGRKMLAAYIILGVVSMLTIIGIIIALVA